MKTKLFILFIFTSIVLQAQIFNPVKWTFSQRSISETELELVFESSIDKPWHMYAMQLPPDGPIPTSFSFTQKKGVELIGKVHSKSKLITQHDPSFDMQLSWYEGKAIFIQKVKILDLDEFSVSGYVQFMCCNDSSCLPPKKEPFSFILKDKKHQKADTIPNVPSIIETPEADTTAVVAPVEEKKDSIAKNYWLPVIEQLKSFNGSSAHADDNRSLWFIFFAGLLGGLLALFTPCVWPIIPMTVSFFLKRNKDKHKGRREAIFYGLSIVVIYVLLGILITLIFGASALNTLSTNAVFNLLFFVILVIFAISFFGYFEITLPASWSTKLNDKAEHTTGLFSIFLMAFTLAVVSFSCTGPIIGTLLVEVSTSGTLIAPAVGMLGFALALALPFSLFALFPAWLNSMPRSGNWMTTIKVTLAFLELAFALKFLSVADLTSGWGILPRNLFIALWVAIFAGLGLFLLGVIRFPHSAKKIHLGKFRLFWALLSFAFAGYLVQGFWGAPLKAVSAFLPPQENIHVFRDYDEGMQYAATHKLPVFVDFTGYGCVNCRKMEAAVFTDNDVKKLLSEFVLISLYVDERKPLNEPILVTENGKPLLLETQGERWSYLQRTKFGANAQPYYILLDNDANPIAHPYAYDEDVNKFVRFLEDALKYYRKK